jgi:DNA-binding transcriptional regulator GbsR (MarR family)
MTLKIPSTSKFSKPLLATETPRAHSSSMKPLTLNKEQLSLLGNVNLFVLLEYFGQPSTPSEVAKALGYPANVVHYRVKLLQNAGVLQVTEQKGRQRKYQLVSSTFRFHKTLLNVCSEAFPQGLEQHLNKIQKHFINEVHKDSARESSYTNDPKNSDYYLLDLQTIASVQDIVPKAVTLEVSLTKQQYLDYQTRLATLLNEIVETASQGDAYTFIVLTCKGRASTL